MKILKFLDVGFVLKKETRTVVKSKNGMKVYVEIEGKSVGVDVTFKAIGVGTFIALRYVIGRISGMMHVWVI